MLSDALACLLRLQEAGIRHIAVATGSGRPKKPMFKWGNTGRGNVKTAILGTCRSCDPQHADCYLAGYEWCFNRPFDLAKNVQRLEPIKHAARSIKRHRDGILVWFDRHIANGLIAGIKSLVPAA